MNCWESVTWLVEKSPIFSLTWRFIIVFKRACHLILSWARLFQSTQSHLICFKTSFSIIIPCLDMARCPNWPFPNIIYDKNSVCISSLSCMLRGAPISSYFGSSCEYYFWKNLNCDARHTLCSAVMFLILCQFLDQLSLFQEILLSYFYVVICFRTIFMVKSFSCTHNISASCRRCMPNYLWHPTNASQTWKHFRISFSQQPMNLSGLMRKRKLNCRGTGVTRISTSQLLSSTMR